MPLESEPHQPTIQYMNGILRLIRNDIEHLKDQVETATGTAAPYKQLKTNIMLSPDVGSHSCLLKP